MKSVYAETGFGNGSFFSTEIEEGDSEYRIPRFIKPQKILGYYIRIWFFKTVFVASTNRGFSITKKNRNKLKILFGISGESELV